MKIFFINSELCTPFLKYNQVFLPKKHILIKILIQKKKKWWKIKDIKQTFSINPLYLFSIRIRIIHYSSKNSHEVPNIFWNLHHSLKFLFYLIDLKLEKLTIMTLRCMTTSFKIKFCYFRYNGLREYKKKIKKSTYLYSLVSIHFTSH